MGLERRIGRRVFLKKVAQMGMGLLPLLFLGCTPHFRLKEMRRELHRFRSRAREARQDGILTGIRDFRGAIHVHSFLSHDSKGTPSEIIQAAREARLSFLAMTDHNNPRIFSEGIEGWVEGVLVIRGMEMIKGCSGGSGAGCASLLGIGMREYIDPHLLTFQEIINTVKDQGGLTFVAHSQAFRDWDLEGYNGMEIYDILDDAVDKPWKFPKYLFDILYSYRRYPEELFLRILDRPEGTLSRWDGLTRTRRVVGIAGNDAHQNTRILGRLLDPYPLSLRFVNTHIFSGELTRETLLDSLARGHSYVSFDILADPEGFLFFATDGAVQGIMGDEVLLTEGLLLRAHLPFPALFVLFRNGEEIRRGISTRLEYPLSLPGVYRMEAFLKIQGRWWPWIFSNPIYVRDGSGQRREMAG